MTIELQEIVRCVRKLKNNKTGGSDGLVGELLKYGGSGILHLLHKLFEVVWREELVPPKWRQGLIVNLFKKGDSGQAPVMCVMALPTYLGAWSMAMATNAMHTVYRDGVCSLLFNLFFIFYHPYIPLHLEEFSMASEQEEKAREREKARDEKAVRHFRYAFNRVDDLKFTVSVLFLSCRHFFVCDFST